MAVIGVSATDATLIGDNNEAVPRIDEPLARLQGAVNELKLF